MNLFEIAMTLYTTADCADAISTIAVNTLGTWATARLIAICRSLLPLRPSR
jgi:hypothetical protein